MSILTTLSREAYSPRAFDAFSPQPEFSLGSAHALAWMCQLAYETAEPDKVRSILGSWDMRPVGEGVLKGMARKVLPVASTHGVMASGRGATILAFAGTDPVSLANWITNFNARIGPGGTAEGYGRALEAVLPAIHSAVAARDPADGPLFLTGHSLGGALAVLAAFHLAGSGIDIAGVYTFGMPRPGNAQFASVSYRPLLGARTYRLVYGADIVPTLAPSWIGFRHVGRLLRCYSGNVFDGGQLSGDCDSDDPQVTADGSEALEGMASKVRFLAEGLANRLGLAARIARGEAPARQDLEVVAAAIELLPPEVRDHLPDRYIGALVRAR